MQSGVDTDNEENPITNSTLIAGSHTKIAVGCNDPLASTAHICVTTGPKRSRMLLDLQSGLNGEYWSSTSSMLNVQDHQLNNLQYYQPVIRIDRPVAQVIPRPVKRIDRPLAQENLLPVTKADHSLSQDNFAENDDLINVSTSPSVGKLKKRKRKNRHRLMKTVPVEEPATPLARGVIERKVHAAGGLCKVSIYQSLNLVSVDDTSLVRVLRNAISKEDTSFIYTNYMNMYGRYCEEVGTFPVVEHSKRGTNYKAMGVGVMHNYRHAPFAIVDTLATCVQDFVIAINPILGKVSSVFQSNFPKHYAQHDEIANLVKTYFPPGLQHLERPLGVWSFMFLNHLHSCTPHVDDKDWPNGYCCIIPFGDFRGGDLIFPELMYQVPFPRGSVAFVKSHYVKHGNMQFEGSRYSIVLTIHNNVAY